MRLSLLQKFIVRSVYESRMKRSPRDTFVQFYRQGNTPPRPSQEGIVNTITKSIERLIERELKVGYGVRTSRKWYIHEVKLTAEGRKQAKKLRGEQQQLPLKNPKP